MPFGKFFPSPLSDLAVQVAGASAETYSLASQTESELRQQRGETDMTATAVTQMTALISEVAGRVQHTAEEATTANALADDGDRVARVPTRPLPRSRRMWPKTSLVRSPVLPSRPTAMSARQT